MDFPRQISLYLHILRMIKRKIKPRNLSSDQLVIVGRVVLADLRQGGGREEDPGGRQILV